MCLLKVLNLMYSYYKIYLLMKNIDSEDNCNTRNVKSKPDKQY